MRRLRRRPAVASSSIRGWITSAGGTTARHRSTGYRPTVLPARRHLQQLRRSVPDLVVPAAVAAGQLSVWTASPEQLAGPRAVVAVLAVLAAAALALRRRRPILALTGAVIPPVLVTAAWGVPQLLAFILPLALALFACGRYAPVRQAAVGAAVGVAAVLLEEAVDPHQTVAAGWLWSLWFPVIVIGGRWVRQQDELARRREGEALEHARAEAAERRLALSRELHDVLTHGISVMVVQAEAAEEVLQRQPDRAAASLQAIQQAGRGALQETRRLVGQLRGDVEALPHHRPSLAAVPDLVAATTAAGVPARFVDDSGDSLLHLPPDAHAAGFRVVQEALTNVLRHAGAVPTLVRLARADGGVCIEVTNDAARTGAVPAVLFPGDASAPRSVPSASGSGGGHGLTGLAERVAACGGRFEAHERADGGFLVSAWLPVSTQLSVAR